MSDPHGTSRERLESSDSSLDGNNIARFPLVAQFQGFDEAFAEHERTKNMQFTRPGTRSSDRPGYEAPAGSIPSYQREQIVGTLREVLVNGLRGMYGTRPSLDFVNAMTEAARILKTEPEALAALVDAHREPASDSSAVLSGRAATGEGIGEALNS